MDVLHHAIWVSDLEATAAFYEDELGLEHSRDFVGGDGVTNYFVIGEGDAEIQFKYDPDEPDAAVDPGDFDHTALSVEDVDSLVDHVVEETDGSLRDGPFDMPDAGVRVAFVEDPDGYGIEFIEQVA